MLFSPLRSHFFENQSQPRVLYTEREMKKVDGFQMMFRWLKGSKWRKASKCKRLIKQVQHRLLIQKARRDSIIRQSRHDIAKLLKTDLFDIALSRAEQLYKDQGCLSAYNQLEDFCDCIYANIGDFDQHRELSSDVKEAVSSLIFAASRCGELPELNRIRILFMQRLGYEFERVNVELQTGNFVNSQMKLNLTINPIIDDVKLQLINEIAKDTTLSLNPQSNEEKLKTQPPEHQYAYPNDINSYYNYDFEEKASIFEEMRRRMASKFSLFTKMINAAAVKMENMQDLSKKINAAAFKMKNIKNPSKMINAPAVEMKNMENSSTIINAASVEMKNMENSSNRTSLDSDGSSPIEETSIVYLDDKEELNIYKHELHKLDSESVTHDGSDCDMLVKENLKLCNEQETVSHSFQDEIEEEEEDESGSRLSYVHPKLPDYDDLVAKFAELKKVYVTKGLIAKQYRNLPLK